MQGAVRDGQIIEAATGCDKLGIDCPLGWPVPFVEFISGHQNGHVVLPPGVEGLDWRRQLAFRTTDAAARTEQKLIPLSVAADRIGHTAMRCPGLLAEFAAGGMQVDRAGTGLVVEVYPAASLWSWNLPIAGTRGRPTPRIATLWSMACCVGRRGSTSADTHSFADTTMTRSTRSWPR